VSDVTDKSGERVPRELDREEVVDALRARERALTPLLGDLDSFVTVDRDWRLTFVNEAAVRMAGMEREDLLGRDLLAIAPPEAVAKAMPQLQKAMVERQEAEFETGELEPGRHYHGRIHPLADGGLALCVRDVTEQHSAESGRREAEERLRLALSAAGLGTYDYDPGSGTLSWDERLKLLWGLEPDAHVTLEQALARLHPDDRARVAGALGSAEDPQGTGDYQVEFRVMWPDGSVHWRQARGRIHHVTERDGTRKPVRDVGVVSDIDESKRAREAEERLLALTDHNPCLVFLKDEEGRYVYLNRAYEERFVHTGDWYGKTDLDFWSRESAELFRANDAAVLALGQTQQFLEDSRDRNGDRYCWLNYKFPFTDAQGRRYAGGIGIDITARVLAEEAQRESEERYRSLFESMDEGYALCELVRDEDGTPVDVCMLESNHAFERHIGLALHDVAGGLRTESVLSSDERLIRACAHVAETGEPERLELLVQGIGRWLSVGLFPREGDRLLALFSDVTERMEAQEALRRSEERFRGFVAASSDVVYRMSPDWKRMRLLEGRQFLPDAGAPREGWLDAYVHPDDRPALLETLDRAIATKSVFELEHRVLRADGSVGWIFSRAVPMLDEDGEVIEWVGAATDVTERKRAQQELRESEARQTARQERSRLARDLHDSVTQALFAATLKAEALQLSAGGLNAEGFKLVDQVRTLSRGALAQMRMLLLELRDDPIEAIPLAQLLRQLVDATESRAKTKVTLTVRGEAALPAGIHEAVYRITQEALNNVVRHSHAARASVELDCGRCHGRLVVEDDGRGFEAAPTSPAHLGMASMKERAAEAGAELSVDSSPGRGTRVTLEWRDDAEGRAGPAEEACSTP
jgi:PAS domain S-box-containing protein